MKKILMCMALACVVAGCATQETPDVTSHYDQMTGSRTDLMDNELQGPEKPRELVWLNAYRTFKSADEMDFYLEVAYMATADVGYLEIPAGPTLTLVLDGQPMALSGTGSQSMRKPYQKDLVRETALYPVTRNQLQKISLARDVKVRVQGNNGLIERDFTKENYERMRRFVTAYAL